MWGSPAFSELRFGSDNLIGLDDPMVDEFASKLVAARTLDDKLLYAKLLDRALQWGDYVIPSFHDPYSLGRIAYWDKFDMPDARPGSGTGAETWWCREAGKREAAAGR